MPIKTQCPRCGRPINAGDALAGKLVKCPNCSGLIRIPLGVGPTTPPDSLPQPIPSPPTDPWAMPPQQPRFDSAPEYGLQPDTASPHYGAPPAGPIPGMIYDAEDISGRQPAAPPVDDSRRPCTACGELIMRDATKCRFCGEVFAGTLARSGGVRRLAADDDEMSAVDWLLAVLIAPVGCIVSIVYLVQGKSKGGKMLGVSILFCILLSVANTVVQNMNRQEYDYYSDDY